MRPADTTLDERSNGRPWVNVIRYRTTRLLAVSLWLGCAGPAKPAATDDGLVQGSVRDRASNSDTVGEPSEREKRSESTAERRPNVGATTPTRDGSVGPSAVPVPSDRSTNATNQPHPIAGSVAAPCPSEAQWPEGMACVPGGRFDRGAEEPESGGGIASVWVDTFWMDRTEVSNASYQACMATGVCARPMPFRGYGRPEQPVVAATWHDANAFCRWKGKRLPTEAEWERAARGPDNAVYPWGDGAPSCELAHVKTREGRGCGTEVTRAVGSGEAGHWGLHDMAGNVDEWVADWYAPCYAGCERECGADCGGENPRGPCGGQSPCPGRLSRVIRGGSWWWPVENARATRRRPAPPANHAHHRFGFRCARDLESTSETPSGHRRGEREGSSSLSENR